MSKNVESSSNISVVKEEIKCEKVEYYEGMKCEKVEHDEIKFEKVEYSEEIKCENPEAETKPDAGPSCAAVKMEGFLCGFCGKHFFYEEFFTEHIQEHHSPPASSVQAGNTTEGILVFWSKELNKQNNLLKTKTAITMKMWN